MRAQHGFRMWVRVLRNALLGDLPVLAAGVALFALLAVIPGVAAVVATYALVADPADIRPQLEDLSRVLPHEVVQLVIEQLERDAARSARELGVALIGTLAFALYSARSTLDATMISLNRLYGVTETRRMLRTFLISLCAAAAVLLGFLALAVIIVALPALLALLPIGSDVGNAILTYLRWPLLLAVSVVALMALYRNAPSPRDHEHRRLFPGALVATLSWTVVSIGLSFWVHHVADYPNLFGAFGSVLIVILWFYSSALTILLGGVVNGELERGGEREPHA